MAALTEEPEGRIGEAVGDEEGEAEPALAGDLRGRPPPCPTIVKPSASMISFLVAIYIYR